MMRIVFLVLTTLLVWQCSFNENKTNVDHKDDSNSSVIESQFIKGLSFMEMRNAFDAKESFKYTPHFDTTFLAPFELEYSVDYGTRFMKAYYVKNDIVAYLPIEFDVDYDIDAFSDKGNKLFIGEYDFNKDGINEILIGYRNYEKGNLIINVIQYFPPTFDKEVLCDYWINLGNLVVNGLKKSDFATIDGNTIKVTNGSILAIENNTFTTEVKGLGE